MCVCVCKACNVHACSGKQHVCVCARCCTHISCTCVAALLGVYVWGGCASAALCVCAWPWIDMCVHICRGTSERELCVHVGAFSYL